MSVTKTRRDEPAAVEPDVIGLIAVLITTRDGSTLTRPGDVEEETKSNLHRNERSRCSSKHNINNDILPAGRLVWKVICFIGKMFHGLIYNLLRATVRLFGKINV